MAGSGGSPPARSARQTTLADFQSQSSGELNAKVEEAPRSMRGGYPAKSQSSPYYGPTGDVSSTPASGNRLRDAPEQVANLVSQKMKGMWRKNN
ncbi:hypothetical protein PF008_g14796 [Phytophthora fragariae]|uniref:Uncharacterized protein n=1 Tax=Phytophthora fragariae TaxID=53985 RepID=A0A6G0RG08_9STRA|nr:hypothetical protein PF008_g14796 [Phytophthora fragariae]